MYGIGLENRHDAQVMVPCPRNYGIQFSPPYSKRKHDRRDTFTHALTGHVMAGQQLVWLIRKGDLLVANENREIEHPLMGSFKAGESQVFELPVYEYLGDQAPERYKIAQQGMCQRNSITHSKH
jgi:hypothetical protein